MLGTVYKFIGYFAIGGAVSVFVSNFIPYGTIFCIVAGVIAAILLALDKEEGVTLKKIFLVLAIAIAVFGVIV